MVLSTFNSDEKSKVILVSKALSEYFSLLNILKIRESITWFNNICIINTIVYTVEYLSYILVYIINLKIMLM